MTNQIKEIIALGADMERYAEDMRKCSNVSKAMFEKLMQRLPKTRRLLLSKKIKQILETTDYDQSA